jgi:hypothetical protein
MRLFPANPPETTGDTPVNIDKSYTHGAMVSDFTAFDDSEGGKAQRDTFFYKSPRQFAPVILLSFLERV